MKPEKEKMLSGELYLASDKELVWERNRAKELLFEINRLSPKMVSEREKLFCELFTTEVVDFHIELPFFCDYGYNIQIGKNFYANYHCTILDCAKVTIGDNVMFAPNVSLFTATHPIDTTLRVEGWEYALPITIGNNVWIGGNSVINPGVTIGDNVVIGSGSVVTKDIPSGVVAFGNPCRVHKQIPSK